ncbi:unnamed protein product [Cochlearia groenlandica]
MSNICELSNDLLVEILSLMNTTQVVSTSLLSKRWRNVWKLVTKVDHRMTMYEKGSKFFDNFLRCNESPILQTVHLKIGRKCAQEAHERWVNIAVARHVRDLKLFHYQDVIPLAFPRSLFTCKSLVVLRLKNLMIQDIPSTLFLQSIKTLSLIHVTFYTDTTTSDKLVHKLLSSCPVLETLVVRRWNNVEKVKRFVIQVPSLQSLYIMERPYDRKHNREDDIEYVIDAPCLKTLKIFDKFSWFCSLVKMPKMVKAEIKIREEDSKKFMGCLTTAKHLSLCLTSNKPILMEKPCENLSQLEYLELCTGCSLDWLCHLLKHSPKLRVLRLNNRNCGMYLNFEPKWEEPCCVPECLVSSIETVEWIGYNGTKAMKEPALYIANNSRHKFHLLC